MEVFSNFVNAEADRKRHLKIMGEFQEQERKRRKQAAVRNFLDYAIRTAISLAASVLAIVWYNMGIIAIPIAFSMFCTGLIFTGMNMESTIRWIRKYLVL